MLTVSLLTLVGLVAAGKKGITGSYLKRVGECWLEDAGQPPAYWLYLHNFHDNDWSWSKVTRKECQKFCDKDDNCYGFQFAIKPVYDGERSPCMMFMEPGPFSIKEGSASDGLRECYVKETGRRPLPPKVKAVDVGLGQCKPVDWKETDWEENPKVINNPESEEYCNRLCVATRHCQAYNYETLGEGYVCQLWISTSDTKLIGYSLDGDDQSHCKVVRPVDGEFTYYKGKCNMVYYEDGTYSGQGTPFGYQWKEDRQDMSYSYTAITLEECKHHCHNDHHCVAFSAHEKGEGICFIHYEKGEWYTNNGVDSYMCYDRLKKGVNLKPRYELVGTGVCLGSRYTNEDRYIKEITFRGGDSYHSEEKCAKQCLKVDDCHGYHVTGYTNNECHIYLEPIAGSRREARNDESTCMRKIPNTPEGRSVDVSGAGFQNYVVVGGAVMTLAVIGAFMASFGRKVVVKDEGNPLLAA